MPEQRSEDPARVTDTLANERTYLAYMRSALAFIAFGFVIARFSLFVREFSALAPHSVGTQPRLSSAFGTAMAVFGIVIALFGAWRYDATDRGLREGRVVRLSATGGYLMAFFVVAVGAVVAFALLAYR
jgi:uncharacterized membrane protein YidH (DUF202 family)